MLMNNTTTEVTVLEFRRLLFELKDFSQQTCIRLRFVGEMWQKNHSQVIQLTESGVVLLEQPTNKLIFVRDLQNVMQFELDNSFQAFQPNFHYTVKLSN